MKLPVQSFCDACGETFVEGDVIRTMLMGTFHADTPCDPYNGMEQALRDDLAERARYP